ncbi:TIGR02452 family protein [Collinsella aerofaciens]|uniref:TIGR02452 family protein n=1 Tax=Collinsella aerofaciens TaxID=74426 RepID=UPI003D7B6E17
MADVDNRNRNRRSNRAGQPNPKREARAKAAERHVAAVSEACAKDIERSLTGVREFDGMPAGFVAAMKAKAQAAAAAEEPVAEVVEADAAEVETAEVEAAEVETAVESEVAPEFTESADEAESAPAEEAAPVLPEVTVLDASATQAILDNGRGYAQFCDMAVLAFASFTNPGGGYIQGYLGQEATLCADSYLYNVLDKQRKWYGENRRRNINCELYRNRALVVPAVRFDRNHVHAYADVIVAAAPNVRRARQEYRVSDDALLDALRDRIRFVLAVCDELGREKLVLGAWGCDNNGFDAEAVAELFREELASGDFKVKQVFFAVPSTRWDEDFAKFEHVLASFPERNEESYAQVAARAAAARAAEQAQAAAEDDEDDDDWRKYL